MSHPGPAGLTAEPPEQPADTAKGVFSRSHLVKTKLKLLPVFLMRFIQAARQAPDCETAESGQQHTCHRSHESQKNACPTANDDMVSYALDKLPLAPGSQTCVLAERREHLAHVPSGCEQQP